MITNEPTDTEILEFLLNQFQMHSPKMTEPQPIAEEIPNLEQVFWDELVVEIKEYHNEQMNAILNRPLPPAGRWVLSYNTLVSNQRMDFIKRLFIYLLLCFLAGEGSCRRYKN